MAKTKKINIKKLIKKHQKKIAGFTSKRWSIAVFIFMAAFAYFTQAYLDAKFNPEVVQANMLHGASEMHEAFKLNEAYEVIASDTENLHYIAPGEENAHVFSFMIESNSDTLVLKGLQLKVDGNVDTREMLEARLMEGEEVISKSKVRDGLVSFSKFTSILQPESTKEFRVHLDITDELKPGARFKFEIENPYALRLYLNDEVDYSLADYPISGGYVSVVGWRK